MPYDRTSYFEQRNRRRLQNAIGDGLTAPEAQVEAAQIHADAVTDASARAAGDIRGTGSLTKFRPSTGGWTDNSGTPQVEAAEVAAGAHKYTADRHLEGVKYATDHKDPFVDSNSGETLPEYGDGGYVPAGKKVVVGERGREIFQATAPGVITPTRQEGAMRRSAWIQKQREAAAMERTKAAHAGPNKLIDFQIQERMREHNLADFNAKMDALYPGPINEKTGKPEGVSPAAFEFKDRYKSMAEMDPGNALKAVGAAMKLSGLVDKYRSGPNPGPGLADANALLQSGKIDQGLYQQLVGGDPAAVIAVESRFMQNPDAALLHPGLLTGQPTPSGKPGLTAPGAPDATPGIHTTRDGDTIRVVVNPNGTRTETLIASAPTPAQIEQWQKDFAQTPEGQLPPGHWKGADGNIYKANPAGNLPTMVAQPVPPAPSPAAPAPGVPGRQLTDIDEAAGTMGSLPWTAPPAPTPAPKLTRPDVEEAGGLFGVPPNRVDLQSLVNASTPDMNFPQPNNPPGGGAPAGVGGGGGWEGPKAQAPFMHQEIPARTISPQAAVENMILGLEGAGRPSNNMENSPPVTNSSADQARRLQAAGGYIPPAQPPERRLEDIRPSAM